MRFNCEVELEIEHDSVEEADRLAESLCALILSMDEAVIAATVEVVVPRRAA